VTLTRTLPPAESRRPPNLGLVVETDGLRYHRSPAQRARDRLRWHSRRLRGACASVR